MPQAAQYGSSTPKKGDLSGDCRFSFGSKHMSEVCPIVPPIILIAILQKR